MTTPTLPAAERFYREAMSRLQPLLDSQRESLDRAAAYCTDAIAADGLVHLFGCGHSRMMCEEMTPRQGCFVGWHTIVELGLTFHNLIVGPNGLRQSLHLEKTPGYAEQILRNFAFGPKDVLIVISTSGIREVIIEMAEGAKGRGLKVIGVVSRAHCDQAKPAHPSGRKLTDVADVILDNGAPVGDTLLTLDGSPGKTGPFSTLGGAGDEHAAVRGGATAGGPRDRAGVPAQPPVRRQPHGRGTTGILLRSICAAHRAVVRPARG